MSIESATAFYQKVISDESFQERYRNVASEEEFKELVLTAGYDFTLEEWQKVIERESPQPSDDELSEAELTEVSGGLGLGGLSGVAAAYGGSWMYRRRK
jgi:predicted ribosomally synthesized peptide with nif11-like leader